MIHLVAAVLIWLTFAGANAPALSAPGAKVPAPARTPPLPTPNPRRAANPIETATAAGNTAQASLKTDRGSATGEEPQTAPATKVQAEALTPEAQHNRQLDAAIAPVRERALSDADAQRLREALKAIATSDPGKARALRAQLTDPAARKLVEWSALRNGFGGPADFMAFSEANPAWPDRQLMRRRAEEQLFVMGGSSQQIRAFFAGSEPQTGAGLAALASAYLAEKDERAKALAATVWREHELAATLETGFLERFRGLLGEADHKRRLDRILVDSVRFSAARSERAAIARRVIPLLSPDEQKKAEARLAVFLQAKAAGKLLAALPAEDENAVDWGLAYQRVQHLRSLGRMDEVWNILQAAPTDPETVISPDDWWSERRAAAYDALYKGKPEIAYAIVRDPGPLSVNPLKDASFLAGWLALRHLGDAKGAVAHFETSRTAADGPLTLARAEYWLGRALEALDRRDDANTHYAAAAKLFDTFHGQLARHKIAAGSAELTASLPAMPTAEEAARFNALDAVQAAVIADKLALDRGIARALFGQLRYHLQTEGELALLAHLAEGLGDPQMAVRIGKTAIARGMNLVSYAYPVHRLPDYKPLRKPPETAMLLGIARQESEFNTAIISTAGARGLLQVMPITARHICRDYKIKCDIPRLLTDTGYNAMIASAYVGDRMAEFSGSYVLTLAGYNAGPGRARQWVRAFGDPRDPKVDPIDWIETIPFEETREYVKKVLSNIQVYRARLGEANALRLADDLKLRGNVVR